MREIVLGTHNVKKRRELQLLLAPRDITVKTLTDFSSPLQIVEDGQSFAANAGKKASQQAIHLRTWVLGEDSGLCVDALAGAPGIYSARFAGEDATDERNNAELLQQLHHVPLEQRGAHYVCHLALANPTGEILIDTEATCHGRICLQPRGTNGFGYDPLFELLEYHRTFGELGVSVKSVLSHRARAMRRFVTMLLDIRTTREFANQ